jgi:hypothetical protein
MPARKPRTAWLNTAPVFAALGDETRLRLVVRLSASETLSITELAAGAGLVRGSRRGRERHWQLEPRQFQEARRCLEAISNQWDEALSRLKAHLAWMSHRTSPLD